MPSGLSLQKGQILFGQLPLSRFKQFGSPVFVFSEERLIDNYKALSKAFTTAYPKTEIFYSVKTNYELQILKTLKKLGSQAEAASGLEVNIALMAGFSPSQIVVDGPAWSDDEIAMFVKHNLRTLNVDSLDLMKRVSAEAKKQKKRVRVSFRIFPEIKISVLKSFVENYISKFGVPLSQAVNAYKQAMQMPNIEIVGISTHIGSMITDPGFYEKTIDRLVSLAAALKKELGINISEINIGGGYGLQSLNYFSLQNIILEKAGISAYKKAASIDEFGRRIGKRFAQNLKKHRLPQISLVLEPGRFLASDSGILITKVVAVKNDWVFIDGGINLIPESIFFIRRGFLVAGKVGLPTDSKYNIAGPTLNTADVLAVNQPLPKVIVGDMIVVLDAGAYSLSRSNQFTILRPNAVFVTSQKKIKYLRHAEPYSDIIRKLVV